MKISKSKINKQNNNSTLFKSATIINISSMLDWSPVFALSFLSFLFSFHSCPLLLAYQPDPFDFFQKHFGLKSFSFWKNSKENDGKDHEDEVLNRMIRRKRRNQMLEATLVIN